ncbi:MAG TPA: hypothetical protein VD994_01885, partial [Prosthecobacter sp.]|nr:hypothetical protein [Prosthecobacter sp.]
LNLRQPQVIAVVHLSQSQKLRWIIARRDGDPLPENEPDARLVFAGYIDDPRTVQALVIGKAPPTLIDAAQALAQVRQGALPVLDLVTLRISGSRKASVHAGADFHFPNGRDQPPNRKGEHDVTQDSAAMPPDTRFDSQFSLDHRIVGFQFHVSGGEWKLTRDARPPEIITDTFTNVPLEWPWVREGAAPPTTTVSVQRPIFSVQQAQGDLPALGQSTLTRLSGDTVLILRTLH